MKLSSKAKFIILTGISSTLLIGLFQNATFSTSFPDRPAVEWNISMVEGARYTAKGQAQISGNYLRPTLLPTRTSNDGRITLGIGGQTLGLNIPEAMTKHLLNDSAGVKLFSQQKNGTISNLYDRTIYTSQTAVSRGHTTLCDGTTQSNIAINPRKNPYSCGALNSDDCYDLNIITAVEYIDSNSKKQQLDFWGTPFTVRVINPKTINASIGGVIVGNPVKGNTFPIGQIREPMVTADGKMMVFRTGNSVFDWVNNKHITKRKKYEIVYTVMPEKSNPCDVTQWQTINPVSHAPYDINMKKSSGGIRYGIAAYPLRDTEGKIYADGEDLHGTYPWVDRRGNNIFFETVSSTLKYKDNTDEMTKYRFNSTCINGEQPGTGSCVDYQDKKSLTRGISVIGSWTHGKVVLLDGIINNTDFGLKRPDEMHRLLDLYKTGSPVRVGNGREGSGADDTFNLDGSILNISQNNGTPSLGSGNLNIIDSLENLFNGFNNLKPASFQDVVWTINTGRGSQEVAFDDYLNPDALIISNMTASLSIQNPDSSYMQYHDGFSKNTQNISFSNEIHLQNAATSISKRWNIPSFGRVVGNGRIEPIAMGGIEGKGFWLDGTTKVEYDILSQPTDVTSSPWFFSLFLDLRNPVSNKLNKLLSFPDGSTIYLYNNTIKNKTALVFKNTVGAPIIDYSGANVSWVQLPKLLGDSSWSNLGLLNKYIKDGNGKLSSQEISIYFNGFKLKTLTFPIDNSSALLKMTVGKLILGEEVSGWIDDFKVIAAEPNPEVICNHARGSLVGFNSDFMGTLATQAKSFSILSHTELTNSLIANGKQTFTKYACYYDYTKEGGAHSANIPSGVTSLRSSVLFPEGPLVFNSPRPNSSANKFCMSCHVAGQPQTLSPAALRYTASINLETDIRRQPMQAPRLIYGNIPAHLFGAGLPAIDQKRPVTNKNPWPGDKWYEY